MQACGIHRLRWMNFWFRETIPGSQPRCFTCEKQQVVPSSNLGQAQKDRGLAQHTTTRGGWTMHCMIAVLLAVKQCVGPFTFTSPVPSWLSETLSWQWLPGEVLCPACLAIFPHAALRHRVPEPLCTFNVTYGCEETYLTLMTKSGFEWNAGYRTGWMWKFRLGVFQASDTLHIM